MLPTISKNRDQAATLPRNGNTWGFLADDIQDIIAQIRNEAEIRESSGHNGFQTICRFRMAVHDYHGCQPKCDACEKLSVSQNKAALAEDVKIFLEQGRGMGTNIDVVFSRAEICSNDPQKPHSPVLSERSRTCSTSQG
jgi:hypothetical protein